MSSQHTGFNGGPPTEAASVTADAPRRIRRAVALPHGKEQTYGSPSVTPGVSSSTGLSPLTAPTARQAPTSAGPAPLRQAEENLSGVAGTTSLPRRELRTLEEDDEAVAVRGGADTAVAETGVTAMSAVAESTVAAAPGAATPSRGSHRPLLVAAAVAGAFLTAVPFVHGNHDVVNYEGMGGATPVATQPSGAHGAGGLGEPEGGASSLPLADPLEGAAPSVAPQPAPVQAPGGEQDTIKKTGQKPSAEHGSSNGQKADSPDPQDPRSAVGKQDGAARVGGHLLTGIGAALGLPQGDSKAVTGPTGKDAPSAGSHESKPSASAHVVPDPTTPAGSTPTSQPATLRSAAATHVSTTASDASTTKASSAVAARTQPAAQPAASKPAAKQWSTHVVQATTVLTPGQSVASNRIRLTMRTDGNLVISDEDGVTRWSSHTTGRGARAVFQADGHLVVYTSDGETAWSSGTAGNDGAELVLQADGNVAILSATGSVLWSAGTQH
ncbi:Curculin domain protein (mannose-binding) lectin [Actinobacteria bacterium OK006]|nr:Curculin domain protein (mannose-binding) lectin [Actinobacteria bacterium OK006]